MPANVNDRDDTLDKFKRWAHESEDGLRDMHDLAQRDQDYYDGHQYTDEEIERLERRKQPIITINKIKRIVNFVYGQEIRTRVDPRAFPMTPHHDNDGIIATDMLRAVSDQIKYNNMRGHAFKNQAVRGIGGVIFSVRKRSRGQRKGKIDILARPVRYDRFFYDPHSEEPDFSDAKYLGLVVWMDVDDALSFYRDQPGAAEAIEASKNVSRTDTEMYDDKPEEWWDSRRKRVRVREIYWRQLDEDGVSQWFVSHYAWGGLLIPPKKVEFINEDGDTYCPMVMLSGYIDRERQRYGMVRDMISPQDEINKRRAKFMHQINRRQVMAEEGAVKDEQEAQNELASPDGWITTNPGAIQNNMIQLIDNGQHEAGQFQLLQQAMQDLDQIGPHAALVGASQRDLSGRSILAQLDAGTQELAPLFDNLRDFDLRCFRTLWYLIKQFKTEEDWLRVRDDDGAGYKFVPLNKRMTKAERVGDLMSHGASPFEAVADVFGPAVAQRGQEAVQAQAQAIAQETGQEPDVNAIAAQLLDQMLSSEQAQEAYTVNDVARLDVDLVLESVPDTAIAEHEEFLELIKLAGQGVPIPPKALIEASSLRSKRKILAEIDRPPDPEQVKAQMLAQKLQIEQLAATVENLKAQAAKTMAQAAESQAKTQIGIPAEAERDEAQAIKLLNDAEKDPNATPSGS